MSRVIDEHRQYLRDRHRLDAFARAIHAVVRPGDRVVDLGSGTGVLGLLACRAGARIVFAIEATGIIGLASAVRDANGMHDRLTFVRGHSTTVTLPERADVIVTDQIGRFGFEGGILECVADARARLLEPDARFVPAAITLHVAPVESGQMYERIEFWDLQPAGLDFHSVRHLAANTVYPARLRPEHLLGPPAATVRLDLASATSERFSFDVTLPIARAGVLHGIGGWFSAELAPGVTMTNSPLDAARIRRRQVLLPIERPVRVMQGDRVDVRVEVLPGQLMVAWEVRVTRSSGSDVFRHSTLRGMLFTREDLEHTRPGFRPALTPRGLARRSALELCDGTRTLAAIEDEVYRRHTDLFASRHEAAVFVAEVVTRYARDAVRPDVDEERALT
ncbi:MAG: 50S ribosomal protein L11 methyltransferase [Acidobacteria bacterium]|nr:50S ribosomal protein L11 methyltransferase [Acidobacteriota bacterium]